MKLNAKQVIERYQFLKSQRHTWEAHWQDLADYFLPRKNEITRRNEVPGRKKGEFLFDNTGMVSCELLAGALHGLLTNPNAQWFELSTGDESLDQDDEVRLYLQWLTRRMHRVLNNTNFQTEVHELYLDLVTFGTGFMSMEKDDELIIRFQTRHISEMFLWESPTGEPEEVVRHFKMDSRAIVSEFAKDIEEKDEKKLEERVGKDVMEDFKRGGKTEFEVVHTVYREKVIGSQSAKPFISQYILLKGEKELRVGGFDSNPYITPRWTKVSGEVYGRSPAMNALPEAKTVNAMTKAVIKGAQKVVDPPVQMPDDGFVKPKQLRPGQVVYYRAGSTDRVQPIFNDTRIDLGVEITRDRQSRIREAFFVDQLQLMQGPQMTATEVNTRTEERMRLLAPILGRQNHEFLRPLINRLFLVMAENNMIGEPPSILGGTNLDVRYSSMIAKAQRGNEGMTILRALEAAGAFIQLDPSSADVLDPEEGLRNVWKLFGAPQEILRSEGAVEAIREARQEAQQAALDRQKEMDSVDAIQKAGPTMLQAEGM